MKKIILTLFTGSILFASCRKDITTDQKIEPCELQTANPAGRSYSSDSVIDYTCTSKHCGLLPLSSKNYWIYEDSVFTDGVFQRIQYDTLRFISNKRTLPDGIIWWESNINIGLPQTLFANDSAFFDLQDRLFTPDIMDVKKEYSLFPGDSLRYLASFEDAAAVGRSLKIESSINCPAGSFNECIFFEKHARNYRRDQLTFKPGIGVIKYVFEKARMGERILLKQQVSTLVKYYIE